MATKTVTIRNKKTGEVKTVPMDQMLQYGVNTPQQTQLGQPQQEAGNSAVQAIQQRLQELQQSGQPQQEQGGFMDKLLQSRALPIAGSMVGGGVGALAGPATGIAGAVGGYGAGDVVRKELSDLLGKKEQHTPESVADTAKGAATAGVSQAVGQTAAYALKFIKPGTVTTFLAKANDMLAKKGFGKISNEVLEKRFMDEVIPKALRWTETQGEDVVEAGAKLVKNKLTPTKVFDAEELNFLRKNLNALGDGAEGMKKSLIDGLAKIVREEQIKRAPGTAIALPLQKGLHETLQGLRAFWPTRMGLMITDMLRNAGAGVGSAVSKYGGAPLIGGASRKKE